MYQRLLVCLLLILVCQIPLANTLIACDCPVSASVINERKRDPEIYYIKKYPYIFQGKLLEISTNTRDINPDVHFGIVPTDYTDVYYKFAISKQWKGAELPESILIHRDLVKWIPNACSVHFQMDKEYIIYASGLDETGNIPFRSAAYCSPTHEIKSDDSSIQLLQQIEKHGLKEVQDLRAKCREETSPDCDKFQ